MARRMRVVFVLVCLLARASTAPGSDEDRSGSLQSREQVAERHAYEHERRAAGQRRGELIRAAMHKRRPLLAANVQCLVRNGTSTAEIDAILEWVCSSEGGGHGCHGIRPGGSHFHPNLPRDHLEWAMTSLHEMHEGKPDHGYRTCWFGGAAYLLPAPVNELFVELPAGGKAGRLVGSGLEDPDRSVEVMALHAGGTIVFEATQHRAFADRKRKQAGFEIHVRAPGPGAILQAEVHTLVRLELL